MRSFLRFWVLVGFVCVPVAEVHARVSTPDKAAAPTVLPSPKRPRLLVIDLVDKGAGGEVVNAINAAVADQATHSFTLGDVVTTQQLRVALDAASTQAMLGCESEACLLDLGKTVEATTILGGSVARVGDDYLVTIIAVNARDGARVGQRQQKVPALRDLYYYAARQMTSLVLVGRAADPRVPVQIKIAAGDGDATFVVDGQEVANGTSTVVPLDPGTHEVRVRASGKAEWKTQIVVEDATPLQLVADLVDSRISLWPVGVGTGLLAVALGTGFVYAGGLAANGYDGSFAGVPGYGTTKADSYLHKSPVDSRTLGDKQADVERAALVANVFAGTSAVFAVATVALVATDLVLNATAE